MEEGTVFSTAALLSDLYSAICSRSVTVAPSITLLSVSVEGGGGGGAILNVYGEEEEDVAE